MNSSASVASRLQPRYRQELAINVLSKKEPREKTWSKLVSLRRPPLRSKGTLTHSPLTIGAVGGRGMGGF